MAGISQQHPPSSCLRLSPFPSDRPPPIGQDSLGLPADLAIDEEANFLLSGGDSLKALHLCEDVLTAVGASSPELLEVLLDRSFADVLHHVARVITAPSLENGPQAKGNKRTAGDPAAGPAKRECNLPPATGHAQVWKVIRRAGEVTDLKSGDEAAHKKSADLCKNPSDLSFALRQKWSSDTGRCVDASPVLLVRSRTTVFIGSHSHRFQALDLASGSCLWERVLGDRIESSAAVTLCGSLVVVGQWRRFSGDFLLLSLHLTGLQKTGFRFIHTYFAQVATTAVYISCAQNLE